MTDTPYGLISPAVFAGKMSNKAGYPVTAYMILSL